ncbi:MAG: MCE family protein [Verrucomicrobia bacterium]|nr:MCE family protein [Verrucomicrobiota bacterium]MCH8510199.1 MlaD family protein [Kiritimatiellia bacterium]
MSTKQRRSDVTTEIVVGAFMFVILVVLLTISVVISQNKLFERTYFLNVRFPDVGGLKTGEPVFLRGVRVGNVNEISVPPSGRGVDVGLRLTMEVELHEDYRFIIEPSSMLGGMRLVIEEGSESMPVLTGDDLEKLKGTPVVHFLDEATETVLLVRKALEEDGILEDIKVFTTNIRDITTKINTGEGSLAKLVNDDALYGQATELVDNLRKASKDIGGITARLAEGKGLVGKLLSEDETLYNDFAATMANLNAATEDARKMLARIEAGEGTVGKLLSADAEVYDDLRDTVAALKEFTGTLNEQEGTLKLLMTEDVLYRKIVSLVDEARATIDDFRETSPITTFSSIFFGAF